MVNNKAEVARLFHFINKKVMNIIGKCFGKMGLTMPQSMVISMLFKHGELKISEISRKLSLSNSTISGIIDRLEKLKIVERIRNKEDKRVVNVKLSKEFSEKHGDFSTLLENNFAKILDKASDEEIDKVLEGLKVLDRIVSIKK